MNYLDYEIDEKKLGKLSLDQAMINDNYKKRLIVLEERIKKFLNRDEIPTCFLTYQEIKKVVESNSSLEVENKAYDLYKYFIYEIFSRMIFLYRSRYQNDIYKKGADFKTEYNLVNRGGIVIFSLSKIPFAKFFLKNYVEENEYEKFLVLLQEFFEKYNLGSITARNNYCYEIKFNIPYFDVIKICFAEMEKIGILEKAEEMYYSTENKKVRQRTTDNN